MLNKPKILPVYLLVLVLALWGVGFEVRAYLKQQKYLRLTIKHVDHAPNCKIGYR